MRSGRNALRNTLYARIMRNWGLYLLMLPAMVIFICFTYLPMYGVIIAFKDFRPASGIWGSRWAGLKYFERYFNSYMFGNTITNTLLISLYTIAVTFPLPIVLALMCNQMYAQKFKKFFQVSTYLPHFISTVVMCGMIIMFLSPSSGIIPRLCGFIGIQTGDLMGNASAFSSIYVWSEVWQHVGWDSIMYIAALSSVDPQLYEAAEVDGASKWQKMLAIDIPMLIPTMMTLFILRCGSLLGVGFEKVYLLQNDLNITTSEIISTYVYKMGLKSNQYSYSAAIGLFNNVVNFAILILVNQISKRLSETSLF
ncbi:MAG: sugar ABC transporter permease [Clostridia bacterium]|nr:sugar ABC transporter permease [Clostridia bacterium]